MTMGHWQRVDTFDEVALGGRRIGRPVPDLRGRCLRPGGDNDVPEYDKGTTGARHVTEGGGPNVRTRKKGWNTVFMCGRGTPYGDDVGARRRN